MEPDLAPFLDALAAGEVIGIPTDTVYGLAVRTDVEGAVRSIFELKGRPEDKPLPVLAADLSSLETVARFDERVRALAGRFWPGPLTVVLPRADGFEADLGGDERATVAVRVPKHPLARAVLERSGPLAVTSANLSGEPAVSIAAEVQAIFPSLLVLDGGPGAGEPSTVLSLVGQDPIILRHGAVSPDALGLEVD